MVEKTKKLSKNQIIFGIVLLLSLVVVTVIIFSIPEQVFVRNETLNQTITDPFQQDAVILIEHDYWLTKSIDESFFSLEAEPYEVFLVLDMNIKNQGYREFSTNPFFWRISVAGERYNPSFVLEPFSDRADTAIIRDGEELSGKLVFNIPEIGLIRDLEIIYDSLRQYNIEYVRVRG